MTYFESAEGVTITRGRAKREFETHGVDGAEWAAFLKEVGDKEEYLAEDVLVWLGY